MILRGRQCKMPCESCAIQFSVFKRKRACSECERYYCSGCLRRGGGIMCAPCRTLSTRPLSRQIIAHLKVRDLQCFLQRQNVSTRGCVEKEELLNLCVSHVNSAAYRRRGSRANTSAFSTLKGLTTNINDFINSAFDLRNPTSSPPPSTRGNCFNSSHLHSPTTNRTDPYVDIPDRQFTTTPGGESNIEVPLPEPASPADITASETHIHVDTTDCFEIEDLDDTGWEFVSRPADPLPNDSEVLMSSAGAGAEAGSAGGGGGAGGAEAAGGGGGGVGGGGGSPRRAASSLELRSASAHDLAPADEEPDTASLQDEPGLVEPPPRTHRDLADDSPRHVDLSWFKLASELESLNVKQLKELLMRNRVEYKGCLERTDLLERAKMLWRDHEKYKNEPADLPIEDSCKICMAAPLECVLLECGHIAACTQCARQLAECPICRQYVVRAVRFFRS